MPSKHLFFQLEEAQSTVAKLVEYKLDLLLVTIIMSQACYELRILLDDDLLLVAIIQSEVCFEERIPLLSAYHRLHVPNYWPWVASHLRLPHHDSAEPKRMHSASLTACGTRHHTAWGRSPS
jgi:hypothetical protein